MAARSQGERRRSQELFIHRPERKQKATPGNRREGTAAVGARDRQPPTHIPNSFKQPSCQAKLIHFLVLRRPSRCGGLCLFAFVRYASVYRDFSHVDDFEKTLSEVAAKIARDPGDEG